jgi:hypothetical protein
MKGMSGYSSYVYCSVIRSIVIPDVHCVTGVHITQPFIAVTVPLLRSELHLLTVTVIPRTTSVGTHFKLIL